MPVDRKLSVLKAPQAVETAKSQRKTIVFNVHPELVLSVNCQGNASQVSHCEFRSLLVWSEYFLEVDVDVNVVLKNRLVQES